GGSGGGGGAAVVDEVPYLLGGVALECVRHEPPTFGVIQPPDAVADLVDAAGSDRQYVTAQPHQQGDDAAVAAALPPHRPPPRVAVGGFDRPGDRCQHVRVGGHLGGGRRIAAVEAEDLAGEVVAPDRHEGRLRGQLVDPLDRLHELDHDAERRRDDAEGVGG